VGAPFTSLGTDGWDSPTAARPHRRFFHVDAESITVAVLAKLGEVKPEVGAQSIAKYRLDLEVSDAL
jgi:pyruvate dehydrogenase E1 component